MARCRVKKTGLTDHRARAGALLAIGVFLVLVMLPRPACAQRDLLTATGARGQLSIDQVSGFRAGFAPGYGPSVTYYGPIGFAIQSASEAIPNAPGDATTHTTTLWFAPSADYFVVSHVSVGALLEVVSTSGSKDVPEQGNPNVSVSSSLPSLLNFTFIPRAGYLVAIGGRWGIWPRFGVGFASRQTLDYSNPNLPNGNVDTLRGLILDLDCGVLFRFNETMFARLAPEVGWLPSGSHTTSPLGNNVDVEGHADFIQFSLTGGIGVLIDL
jgi:hypothetical protein